jgi:hypothetical protein
MSASSVKSPIATSIARKSASTRSRCRRLSFCREPLRTSLHAFEELVRPRLVVKTDSESVLRSKQHIELERLNAPGSLLILRIVTKPSFATRVFSRSDSLTHDPVLSNQ